MAVTVTTFGQLEGREVFCITLEGDRGFGARILTLGTTLQGVTVPDRRGTPVDVCLGYDTPEEYRRNDGYLGATVGRCANRIAGSRFTLGGVEYRLTPNEGENQLHGGPLGFDKKLWDYRLGENSVTLSCSSPHLEEGYPGNARVSVTYTLGPGYSLMAEYRGVCDRDTVMNLTNHSYWNLSGQGSGPVLDQELAIAARSYTPCGAGNIPLGTLLPVEGTPLDFSGAKAIGRELDSPLLAPTKGYDHNLALEGEGMGPRARAYSPGTGITMELFTDLPGLQLYTANFLSPRRGKGGAQYGPYHGFCLETQYYPNAVNVPDFPSPVLRAGETYLHRTRWAFGLEG